MCLQWFHCPIHKVARANFVTIKISAFGVGQIVSFSYVNFSKLRHTIFMLLFELWKQLFGMLVSIFGAIWSCRFYKRLICLKVNPKITKIWKQKKIDLWFQEIEYFANVTLWIWQSDYCNLSEKITLFLLTVLK